jgi:hypothetical protein
MHRGTTTNLCENYFALLAPCIPLLNYASLLVSMPPSRGYSCGYCRGRRTPHGISTTHTSNSNPNSPRVMLEDKVVAHEYREQVPNNIQDEMENLEEDIRLDQCNIHKWDIEVDIGDRIPYLERSRARDTKY